ncbi:helix-turn-helix domain-containing protein [Rhodopirellula bahusiensis]|uniref:helix-turn-helix domain-containing protein n=1 Tax=Rhodopirellula bahusiensis TaxID=2014065 RepID=UPI0032665E51
MSINTSSLGRRLKEARKNCGLTQQQVADELGIQRTAVVNIESGERALSTLELTKFARLYGRTISELLNEPATDEDIFVVLHRLDEEFSEDSEVHREVNNHVAICREGHDLKELLGISNEDSSPEYLMPEPESTIEAVEQGAEVATQERRRLSLGSNPLPDLAKLIASQGIWAAKAVLPDEMSGMFLLHPTFGSAILINQDHPLSRRRFSFAHEYAHALLDRNTTATVSSSKNRKDLREVRANAFAASFLLPAEGIHSFLLHRRKTVPSRIEQIVYDPMAHGTDEFVEAKQRVKASNSKITYQDVASLMYYFRTSYQATCYRLKSLELVNKDELTELLEKEDVAKTAFKVLKLFDDATTEGENDSQFDQDVLRLQVLNLAVEAYRREEVSRGRLRDLSSVLGIKSGDLLKLAEAA